MENDTLTEIETLSIVLGPTAISQLQLIAHYRTVSNPKLGKCSLTEALEIAVKNEYQRSSQALEESDLPKP